jgi:hypothetical protein
MTKISNQTSIVLFTSTAIALLWSQLTFALDLSCLKSAKHVCAIPIGVLYSDRERFLGASVMLRGFLYENDEELALFQDEVSMKHGSKEGAIMLVLSQPEQRADIRHFRGEYVQVVGQLRESKVSSAYFVELVLARPPQNVPIVSEHMENLPPPNGD